MTGGDVGAWGSEPGAGELEVTISGGSDEVVIALAGELDAATAPRLRGVIADQVQPMAFDVKALRFCDSSGLACFIAAYKAFGSCRIIGVSKTLRHLLDITGLLAEFDVSEADPPPTT